MVQMYIVHCCRSSYDKVHMYSSLLQEQLCYSSHEQCTGYTFVGVAVL